MRRGISSFFIEMLFLSEMTITRATNAAIAFLKKLFSIDGRSPESLTNMFMAANENADINMHMIPFALLSILADGITMRLSATMGNFVRRISFLGLHLDRRRL